MNIDVKEFIEKNIELIEEYNFKSLYSKWYNKEAYGGIVSDEPRVDELNEILYETKIATLSDTFEARKEVIVEDLQVVIQEWINDIDFWTGSPNYLPVNYILERKLASTLGLDLDVIKELIYEVATSLGLRHHKSGLDDGYYINR